MSDAVQVPDGAVQAGSVARRRRRLLAVAAALALPPLLVRGCVLDASLVESDSMEPAFHGEPGAGDRLLVLRRSCDARTLQRWDVVVVDGAVDPELPTGVSALLKRVTGLPDEWIFIANGDVYVAEAGAPGAPGERAARIARKPDDLIAALLVPLHAERGLQAPWTWVGPGTREELPDGGTRLTAGASQGVAVFERLLDDGLPGQPGETAVADTALAVELGACAGVLELRLREGATVFSARLAPRAQGGASLHHNLGGGIVASAPDFAGLQPGQTVLMWNVDDGVRVRVDGRTLLAWDDATSEAPIGGPPAHNEPWLGVEGGAIDLRRVEVLRDVHFLAQGVYGSDGQAPFHLPDAHVFVLGDHSRRSRDSRYFGPVPVSMIRGRPFAIYSPWRRAGWLRPAGTPW